MQKIIKRYVEEHDLTILEVVAQVSAEDILSCMKDFYSASPSMNLIWDVSRGNLGDLTADDVSTFHALAMVNIGVRKGGKTVLVSNSVSNSMLLKYIKSVSDMEQDLPISLDVAQSQDEAIEMIKELVPE